MKIIKDLSRFLRKLIGIKLWGWGRFVHSYCLEVKCLKAVSEFVLLLHLGFIFGAPK